MKTRTSNPSATGFFSLKLFLLLLLLSLGTLLDQADCSAQGTTYTSRSAFDAALTSSATVTFEGIAPSSASSIGVSSITSTGVTFSSAGARLFITSPTSDLHPIPGTGQYLWNFDSSESVDISLPGGMTAFGADFSGGMQPQTPFNATLTAILQSGLSYSYNFSGTTASWGFFGVTFPQPIVSLVYHDGGQSFPGTHEEMLDNVTIGTVVPEPQTSLLVLLGLVTWSCIRRHSRTASPTRSH